MNDQTKAVLADVLNKIGAKYGKGLAAEVDTTTPFRINVVGRVGRCNLPTEGILFSGEHVRGVPGERQSSSTPSAALICWLLAQFSEAARRRILDAPPTADAVEQFAGAVENHWAKLAGEHLCLQVARTKTVKTTAPVKVTFNVE